MVPMAATAEDAMPEMAPKMAVATMTTTPMPPRTRPKMLSARSTRRAAMPPWLMMPPARI